MDINPFKKYKNDDIILYFVCSQRSNFYEALTTISKNIPNIKITHKYGHYYYFN